MAMDMDSESRRNRFTGSMDCLRDLVCAAQPGIGPTHPDLGALLDLLAAEAHALYDEPERGYGIAHND